MLPPEERGIASERLKSKIRKPARLQKLNSQALYWYTKFILNKQAIQTSVMYSNFIYLCSLKSFIHTQKKNIEAVLTILSFSKTRRMMKATSFFLSIPQQQEQIQQS
jgi:hypothetical protein